MSLQELAQPRGTEHGTPTSVPAPPRRWATRWLLPVALLAVTAALLLGTAWTTLFPGPEVDVVPVMVKSVEASSGQVTVSASGWLEPDPFARFAAALAGGIVEEVTVLEGQTVRKGQVVARLITDDARLALERALADLSMGEAEVARADAQLTASREIMDTLVGRRAALAAAEGAVAEMEAASERVESRVEAQTARIASLEDEIERKSQLVESGAVSEGELRRLELKRDAERAELAAIERERKMLAGQLQQARADHDLAREHTELLIEERRDVRMAEAEAQRAAAARRRAEAVRDEAQLRLDRMTVRAPCDGVVLRRLVSPGSRLVVGGDEHAAHVVHIYDPDSLQVRVDVPLADAGAVGVGQPAEIVVQVRPDRTFRGKVTRLVHRADIQKNTVEVKVAIEDPDPVLKPEMLARVRFLAGEQQVDSRQRLLVPEQALEQDGASTHLWIVVDRVADRGVAERRAVELGAVVEQDPSPGAAGARWREVTSGLQPGDRIILGPPAGLGSGDRITVRSARTGGRP